MQWFFVLLIVMFVCNLVSVVLLLLMNALTPNNTFIVCSNAFGSLSILSMAIFFGFAWKKFRGCSDSYYHMSSNEHMTYHDDTSKIIDGYSEQFRVPVKGGKGYQKFVPDPARDEYLTADMLAQALGV